MHYKRIPLVACLCALAAVPVIGAENSEGSLNEIAAQRAKVESARYQEAEALYQQAMAKYRKGLYEEASRLVERAITAFPGHSQAQDLRRQIGAMLSDRPSTLQTLAEELAAKKKLELQEQAIRMRSLLASGDRKMEAGDYLGASQDYDRVVVMIKTFPYRYDWGSLPEEVEAKRNEALIQMRNQDLQRRQQERERTQQLEQDKVAEQERQLTTKVDEILARAQRAMERQDYRRAEALAYSAYELDRRREDARNLYLAARREAHLKFARTTRMERDERIQRVSEDIHQSLIPQNDLLVFPDDWYRRSQRKPAAVGETVQEAWKDDIRRRMEQRIDLNFDNLPFVDVMAYLRDVTGLNVIVSQDVLASGDVPDISMRAKDMSVQVALKWILEQADLNMALRDEAIYISEDEIKGDLVTRIYDIADLIMPKPDFPGMEIAYAEESSFGGDIFGDGFGDGGGRTEDDVIEFIEQSIAPESWGEDGVAVEVRINQLFVTQAPEIHSEIVELLDNIRNQQNLQVKMQIRVLTVSKSFFEEIGVGLQAISDTPNTEFLSESFYRLPPRQVANPNIYEQRNEGNTFLGSTGLNVNFLAIPPNNPNLGNTSLPLMNLILAAAEQEGDSQSLLAPEIVSFNGQRANATFLNQYAYIYDYTVVGDEFDPQIRTLNTGTLIDVRPVVSSDRKYITLEIRPSIARLIATTITDVSGGDGSGDLPIELPTIEIQTLRTTAMLPDQGSLITGGYVQGLRQRSHSGIPFLAHVPFLGRLFGRNGVYDDDSKIYYMISGTIMDMSEIESMQ